MVTSSMKELADEGVGCGPGGPPHIILMVAAERFELQHIRPQAGWVLTANGPGPALAGEAVDRVDSKVDAVVSIGLCGALADGLRVGDIVVGSAVNGVEIELPEVAGRHVIGPIASVDRVAQTVAEKVLLRETGAIAVEMEAAAVLERARRWGVPFYCIRAVSDTATEGFELDLNAARDRSGRFRVGQILAQTIRRPFTGVPELLRLKRNSEAASKALGEFIGNCSF
jgi:adenosylhomocysteine nucleosidase